MAGNIILRYVTLPALVLLLTANQIRSTKLSTFEYKDNQRKQCIKELQDEYRRVIGPHVKGKFVQLVDMVFHFNFGDCFIEYGEQLFIQEMGIPIRVYCSLRNCDYNVIQKQINRHPNNSVVVIHGGGNFGDRYREIQLHHLELTKTFRELPIVSLPQTVSYFHGENAKEDARVFAEHPKLFLLARDFRSLDYLKTYFPKTPSELCPDGAFMIGPQDSSRCKPKVDIFFLKRKDHEGREDHGNFESSLVELDRRNVTYKVDDWPCGLMNKRSLKHSLKKCKNAFESGRECLCDGGRVVVSDRLHASILATLLGLPYVYLDTVNKKITGYREAIFAPRPSCKDENMRAYKATSWKQAVGLALKALDDLRV